MSSLAVLGAIKAVASGFATPVFWPNEKIVPPDPPSPYVWVEITGLGSDLLSAGTQSLAERRGFIRLHILGPYGDGLEEPTTVSDSLAALYGMLTNVGGIQGLNTFVPTDPEIGAQSDDGLWYGVSRSVPYKYWTGATS